MSTITSTTDGTAADAGLPAPPIQPPPPTPPSDGPIGLDGTRPPSDATQKYSNQCLETSLVSNFQLTAPPTVKQTIIDTLVKVQRTEPTAFTIQNLDVLRVMSDNSLNQESGAILAGQVFTDFPMTINNGPVIRRSEIVFTDPIYDSTLDFSRAQAYLQAGAVTSRSIVSAVRGGFSMSRAFAEGMCPEFRSGLRPYDLTTLFTIGHLMTHTLFSAQQNGWPIRRNGNDFDVCYD